MFESDEQFFKEQAIVLAIKNNLALFDRGTEVYAIRPDGYIMLLSKSEETSNVWDQALRTLKKIYGKRLFNHE